MNDMTTPTQHTADYLDLNPGDVLQNGDEFRWDGEWRTLEIHRYWVDRHAIRGIRYRRPLSIAAQFSQFERNDAAKLKPILRDVWFPRHPLGGNEIYSNGETNDPLATFRNSVECERAIQCHNACAGIPDPAATLKAVREALEKYRSAWRIVTDGPDDSDEQHAARLLNEAHQLGKAALALLAPNQDAKV